MKNLKQMHGQSGFTLIELVVVIVILGILAATALPKFIDVSDDARRAAAQGVAGALASGSSINYSANIARGGVNGAPLASTTTGTSGIVDTSTGCTIGVATNLMQAGVTFNATDKSAYNVSGGTAPVNRGDTTTCTVTNNEKPDIKATFTLIGAK